METNGGTTVEKIGKGIGIAAEAAVVGVIGTVAAFGTAVTDVIIPATAQAAQETKALFPDPLNPGTDSEPYVKCLGIAAKTGAVGFAGVVAAGAKATTDALIPATVNGVREIKKLFEEKGE